MKIRIFTLMAMILGLSFGTKADEGMWLPLLIERLNYVDMQKMGLHLSPEELYSANNSSLKDAIVRFDQGCTGEMVSQNGLLMTAHHCGYDFIQMNSTTDKNYLRDGFWAKSRSEELPCPGLTVQFLVRIEDVTDEVLKGTDLNQTEISRNNKINTAIAKLTETATKKTSYTAEVKSFFEGKEYYMFVYQTFRDVRLVGAPSAYLGNYGGDTDNWMWPRHNSDFSFFRVYCAQDGSPADYSINNIEYKPKHFLPISQKGVKEGDFTMTWGFPSKTDRYITSLGIKMATDQTNPAMIKIREKKLSILKESMQSSPELNLKYTAKYQNTSNYWKFFQGQNKNIQRLDLYDKKKAEENVFKKWAEADPARNKYTSVMKDISDAYADIMKYNLTKIYHAEVIKRGTDILMLANKFMPLYNALCEYDRASSKDKKAMKEQIMSIANGLREDVRENIRNTDNATDKKVFSALMKMYYNNIVSEQHPEILNTLNKDFEGSIDVFSDAVYGKSMFTDPNKIWYFLSNPDKGSLEFDLAFKTLLSFIKNDQKMDALMIEANWKLTKAKRLYIDGLKEMYPNKKFYSDANNSMRMSYGKVAGYIPMDGLVADYFTTLDGLMQKEDERNPEFTVPANLKLQHQYRDYGSYATNNQLRTDFITDNDITGGNSGGPMINADGQIVGVVFDLNWEAMSGDFAYVPNMQRCISTDAKYILFIIDKLGKDDYILNELKIIKE